MTYLGIILRAPIDIVDLQGDWRSGCQIPGAFLNGHNAGENADPIRFFALGGETRLTGLSPIEPMLNLRLGDRDPRRTTVDHAAQRRAVALAPGSDPKKVTESVV